VQSVRITFLGTSAGMPTRDRNVASVAVTLDGSTLLFDCGEATQHQLMRSGVRAGSIDAVFLTHLHGDHLFGLPGLLASMSLNARERPLDVFGPGGLATFIDALPLFHTSFEVRVHDVATYRGNGFQVDAAPVEHSAPCFAYRIVEDDRPGPFDVARARELGVPSGPLFGRLQNGDDVTLDDGRIVRSDQVVGAPRRGRRVVYCTDTRPCAAAADLARSADVLIHESTYANDMAVEAQERMHSTAAEAARVAGDAGVQKLILTHISPRYLDAGVLLDEAQAVFAETEVASDFAVFEVEAM
jgi:ribonuclease Z